jgi:hypothetical protein
LPIAELRAQADDVARRIRELDTDIQRTNWLIKVDKSLIKIPMILISG